MKTKLKKNYFNMSSHISIHNFPILFLFNEIEARDYIVTAPIYLKFYIIPALILLYL
jgi:hypothetical protein